MAGQHHVSRADQDSVVVIQLEQCIGPRRHHDLVLAPRPDRNNRHAGGLRLEPPDARGVDPLCRQRRNGALAMGIVPHGPNDAHPRPDARRRNRLVGSLPAVVRAELAAQHGLTGEGEPIGDDNQVDVEGGDDDDVCAHRSSMPDCTGRRALPS